WLTRNWSLMCILLKSPVRSWTVTSVTRPTSLSGVSVGVSPRTCLLNISGARRLYHTFAFHLSLILRAAARDFFSAMRGVRRGGGIFKDWRVLHDRRNTRVDAIALGHQENRRPRPDRDPAEWRKKWRCGTQVILRSRGESVEILPREKASLTAFFDRVEFDVKADLSDWHALRRDLRKKQDSNHVVDANVVSSG